MSNPGSGARLRVAIVIDQLAVAGSEIQMLRLSQGLRALGHDVVMLVLGTISNSPDREYEQAVKCGVVILHMDKGPAGAVLWCLRYLRRERFDIVYGVMSRSCMFLALARPVLGGSKVLVAQRYMFSEVSGYRRILRGLPQILADGVVTNSDAAARELRRRSFVRRKSIWVVPNALSGSALEKVEALPAESPLPVITCLANLRPPKGHATLLEAAALLEQRGRPVVLSFVGAGVLESDLRLQAAALGVRVRWNGQVEDPRQLIASSDIIVQASLSEGLPNAVLEAMAQGKPVVATDVGGTAELLGSAGVLVKAGDPASLANGLEYILTNPTVSKLMGTRARERAKAYTVAAAAQRHVNCFEAALEGRR